MYETHYGFREKPFNLTPDPKYLYLSRRHADAFAHLEFGRRERGGFVVVTGEVGTGKTTLARYFLGHLGDGTATAVVLYPALTAGELLRTIVEDLHVETRGTSLKDLVDALHTFLLEAHRGSREVILLIDEAQDLSPEVLEQIRLISNLETDTEKLLTIVLIGQSELGELLERRELRQLAQRVTARCHLGPLRREETEEYVRHRIEVAGGSGKVAFSPGALAAVHARSGGIPRLVNLICDRALLAGYVRGVRMVDAGMVRRAAREVHPSRPRRRGLYATIAGGAAIALLLAAFWLPAASPPGPEQPTVRTEAVQPSPLESLLLTLPKQASLEGSLARVAALWGTEPLQRTTIQTHMAHLRRLDLPAVLEVFHPARPDTCFLALVGLDGDEAVVSAGGSGPPLRVPVEELDRHWTRQATFLWSDAALKTDRDGWVRSTLGRLGYRSGAADLAAVVARFQRDAELTPDGVVGSRTLLALVGLGSEARPRLDVSARTATAAAAPQPGGPS